MADVHALTDVTGFGLLGHLLGLCRASRLGASIELDRLPLHPEALELARQGFVTGASARNWQSYGEDVELDSAIDAAQRSLLTDPQTSGGLLAAVAPDAVPAALALFHDEGFAHARVIGECVAGPSRVSVR
jgi:selenide,water dikinase